MAADKVQLRQRSGVDISATAIELAKQAVIDRVVQAANVSFFASDPSVWLDQRDDKFHLITASFLQSPVGLDHAKVLRNAAKKVAPEGHPLLISHAEAPPWMTGHRPASSFPQPEDELEMLNLDKDSLREIMAELRGRTVQDSAGQEVLLKDTVVLAQNSLKS